jgi:hypothetical protein
MSGFYGTTSGTAGVGIQQSELNTIDSRLLSRRYRHVPGWTVVYDSFPGRDGFVSPWWPVRDSLDASGDEWLIGRQFEEIELVSGARSMVGFSGITRDAYGTPLGGCTVRLHITSTTGEVGANTVIYTATSDSVTGAFVVFSPYYPNTHYIVSYKAGSPDVQGITLNTLVGA